MPTTPWRRMSSATQNASCSGVPSSTRSSRRSFETTIIASTCSASSPIASSACRVRRIPSKEKGLVTTPTVSAPLCFAASATTADAPEPVPPPIPETTKTMSDPPTIWLIWSNDSSADARPIAGLPPAPSPRDVAAPSRGGWGKLASSAWMSVLIDHTRRVEVALPELDHPVHRVAAAAHADHFNDTGACDSRRRARRAENCGRATPATDLVGRGGAEWHEEQNAHGSERARPRRCVWRQWPRAPQPQSPRVWRRCSSLWARNF